MITVNTSDAFHRLTARLVRRAAILATARAASRKLASRNADATWRRADLLWPHFTQDTFNQGEP